MLVVAAGLFMFAAVSCKKTCSCETVSGGVTLAAVEVEIEKGKCSDMDVEVSALGTTSKTTCTAK